MILSTIDLTIYRETSIFFSHLSEAILYYGTVRPIIPFQEHNLKQQVRIREGHTKFDPIRNAKKTIEVDSKYQDWQSMSYPNLWFVSIPNNAINAQS